MKEEQPHFQKTTNVPDVFYWRTRFPSEFSYFAGYDTRFAGDIKRQF